jgi:hypothetical protein
MNAATGLAAALMLMTVGPAQAEPRQGDAAAFVSRSDLVRRPVVFGPSAGDLRLEVVAAGVHCRFEGSDGRTAAQVWMLSRGGRAVAVVPVEGLNTAAIQAGRFGPLRPPARSVLAPANGSLPLSDGLAALEARLVRDAWSADAQVSLNCSPPTRVRTGLTPARKPTTAETVAVVPVQVMGLVLFTPVILFGVPAENASLLEAAAEGPTIADRLAPGEPLPGGFDAFVREHRRSVRVHRDPGSDYAVLSVDLGGRPRYGVGTPREAVFFGVRAGVVEWRARGGLGVETSLCANARGQFGGRKGCSTTGYYDPRP